MERDQEVGTELEQKDPNGPPAIRIATKNPFVKQYAQAILDAVQIREGSYDKEASDAATEEQTKKAKESDMKDWMDCTPGRSTELVDWMFSVDYSQFYKKDIHQSSNEAVLKNGLPIEMGYSIYLSLATGWNDIIDWAQEQLGL